jgi:very-short-patch-repair endonuclease
LQRLNVGFSRAKERIHIFHSQPFDSFRGAISQAISHYRNQLEIARKRPDADDTDPSSPMEARVLNWLGQTVFIQKLGDLVEIDTQFELGAYLRQLDPTYKHPAYRVDFLLKVQSQKGPINIIIEYDGFKEHFTNLTEVDAANYGDYYKAEDVERQKVLEGYGYRFLRINRFNVGRDPVRTLDERLLRLASEALQDVQPHGMVGEVNETAEAIITGEKKVCTTCGEVRAMDDFRDAATRSGMGRKCRHCKEEEARANAQNAADRAVHRTGRGRWRRRPQRRW